MVLGEGLILLPLIFFFFFTTFFFKLWVYLFIYLWLRWVFVSVRAWASRHRGLSCCGAQAPDAQAQ